MKFKIKNNIFSEAINNVNRALSTKTPMPILKSIKMDLTNEGIFLTASDSNITIKQFIPTFINDIQVINIDEVGSAAVPGKLLLEVLRKANDEFVELTMFEGKVININFKNSDFTLNCLDVKEYPNIDLISTDNPIELDSNQLNEIIKQTVISVSTNESRPILTGVNFKIQNNILSCVATDSYRLSEKVVSFDFDLPNINIVVPGKSLLELEKLLITSQGNVQIHLTNNIISFKMKNIIFQSRLLDGSYPETSRLIPKEFGLTQQFNRQELINVVDRVSLLSREGATNIIKFDIYEDKTIVSLDSPEIGKVVEEVQPLSQEGSLIRIGFNSKYLLDALKVLSDNKVTIKFTGEVRPFIIKTNDESITQLILPVRIE
ncbi:DNA polymerase III subunit beta [Mycoplasmatota bacterium]|nr:DNA polymerase III subunit beta [Mycoplasmatota bacterium]